MAQQDDVHTGRDLVVTFSREGETEAMQVCDTGENALKAAQTMLEMQDALRAGDSIKVEWHRPQTLIDRNLG